MDFHSKSHRPPPKGWVEALEKGLADIEAGRTVDAEAFFQRLEREDAALPSKPSRATSNS